jgi:hypothetical protein
MPPRPLLAPFKSVQLSLPALPFTSKTFITKSMKSVSSFEKTIESSGLIPLFSHTTIHTTIHKHYPQPLSPHHYPILHRSTNINILIGFSVAVEIGTSFGGFDGSLSGAIASTNQTTQSAQSSSMKSSIVKSFVYVVPVKVVLFVPSNYGTLIKTCTEFPII